jgi:NAD(P)-dependent dehydrogenase (short-subunit alcohol dehydrogenase family)
VRRLAAETTDAAFDLMSAVDVRAPFFLTAALAPPMATYLAGEDARPITGAVHAVDAGRVATL